MESDADHVRYGFMSTDHPTGKAGKPLRTENDIAFPRLNEDQLATMRAAGHVEAIEKDQILFEPGDNDYDFIVVLEGCIEIIDAIDTPNERALTSYGPRQFSGELNFVTSEPSFLTARVAISGEAIFIDRASFRGLISRDPRLGDMIINAYITRRAYIIEDEGGARLIGSGLDPATRALREFLTRNRVPHRFIDLEASGIAAPLPDGHVPAAEDLPVLVTGGKVLRAPSILEAANALNLRAQNKTSDFPWDCLIVGGGPGGLGAAVYASTEGLSTMMIDATALGGQASTSSRIENYLGFPTGISGSELTERAIAQARRFGLRTAVPERAQSLRSEGGRYVVSLDSGDELAARAVVLATGASYRILPIEGIERLNGAGVFYAATFVEARTCGAGEVAVIGGGNSAGQAAIFLAGLKEKVSIILRSGELGASMSHYLVEQIADIENIDVLLHTEVRELHGDNELSGMTIEENRSGERRDMSVDGLFVFVGADPCTEWLDGQLAKDDKGFLLTGGELEVTHLDNARASGGRAALPLETSLPGVFAVGDGRNGSVKRVASAVGEGSMAIRLVHEYLASLR
jgi:thioredoxin reductase (NADPH)